MVPLSLPVTKEISYEDLKGLLGKSQNLLLVDVRTKEEVDKGRIPGSVHIPGELLLNCVKIKWCVAQPHTEHRCFIPSASPLIILKFSWVSC